MRFLIINIATALLVPIMVFVAKTDSADQHTNKIVLENARLKIEIDTANGLRISRIFSKAQNRDLVDPYHTIPLYQIDLYEKAAPTTIQSSKSEPIITERPNQSTLRFTVKHINKGLDVIATINLDSQAQLARFFIEIKRKDTAYRIGSIRYPGYGLPIANKRLQIMLPVADGQLILDPQKSMKRDETRAYNYPGMASAQVMAAYDDQGGIVTYAADGTGQFKQLKVGRHNKNLFMYFENITFHLNESTISVPYAIELGDFSGSWESAADIYKKWAIKQRWCQTLIEDKKRIKKLLTPSLYLGLFVRTQATGGKDENRIAEIPSIVQGWASGLKIPVTALLVSWEKHGPWIAPDYFPPYGGESIFRNMVKHIHDQGNMAFLFLSGLNFTLEKNPMHGARAFKASTSKLKEVEANAIVGQNREPLREGKPDEGTGRRLTVCPATPFASKLLTDSFKKAADLGVDIIQVDQIVGGGTPVCFSNLHGHPPVGGDYMYRSVSRLLDALPDDNQAKGGSPLISLEEPGELFINHVDLFHTREYMQGLWPRDGSGVIGIPLFSYLYHEYALGFGGDSAPIATSSDMLPIAIYAQAMNLVTGKLPGVSVWLKNIKFSDVSTLQRDFMINTASLMKSEAGKFILQGKFLPLTEQKSENQQLQFTLLDKKYSINAPNLLSRGFQLKNGATGFIYVNLTDKTIRRTIKFAVKQIESSAKIIWPASKGAIRSGDNYEFPPYGILFIKK